MDYEILEYIAVLSKRGYWQKELNLIRWNGKWDKYDIRDWAEDHRIMSKGVTLTLEELVRLKDALTHYENC